MQTTIDFERRFGGVARLYGAAGLAQLQAAHVVVIGIGGVGSWAAEALARNAVGCITLIDLDNVAESNFNRQLHAVDANIGKPKISAMRERILQINPLCNVYEIEDFITPDNLAILLANSMAGAPPAMLVLDCIDDAKAKIALADYCKRQHLPLVMSGSAGGRLDPTRIKTADLSHVTGDKLLAKVRNQLRRDFQFPKATNTKKSAKFGITCVYSDEPVIAPQTNATKIPALQPQGLHPQNSPAEAGYSYVKPNIHAGSGDALNEPANCGLTGLNCAGYGASVCVTAPFGFTVAQLAIGQLLQAR